MRLEQTGWMEVRDKLKNPQGIIMATGSTEQHGPIGLIGTDTICSCLLYTSPSPRDAHESRMPSSA